MSIIAGLSVGIAGVGLSIGVGGGQGMIFRNRPIPNLQLSIYVLALRGPGQPPPLVISYIFPISPESLAKPSQWKTNVYDTAGSSQQNGVQRNADLYGLAPANYVIAGTTGWQLHGTDGFSLTGQQSIIQLQSILATYASKNAQQVATGNPQLYTLELYDYFNQEYWQVVPVGELIIRQSVARPILQYYEMRFAGMQKLSAAPPPPVDVIASSFGAAAGQASINLSASLGGTAGLYVGVTIPVL